MFKLSLTVSIARKAIDLMQPGVRFTHGVQFRMSKGALLSHTHEHVTTSINHANTCLCMYICIQPAILGGRIEGKKQKEIEREGRKESIMKACLTIFTDVPFCPAGGCLLLLFLTQHQSEEGQMKPMDRERTYTHSEKIDTISTQFWLGHKSPWLITRTQSNSE